MRVTRFVFQTIREEQAEAELISHQLMLRAGLVRQVAAGILWKIFRWMMGLSMRC